MSIIILAFIFGLLCGMGYMYLHYNEIMRNHLKELERLKLRGAEVDGALRILNIINGIDKPDLEEVANEN